MHIQQDQLSRKIEWACDLHAAEMEASFRERQSTAPNIMKRATGFFTATALYVAIVVMWVAIAIKLV